MPIKGGMKSFQCSGTVVGCSCGIVCFLWFLLSKCFEKRIIYCNFTEIKKNL